MHTPQANWTALKARLNQALEHYDGTPTELSQVTGINFYAVRRFLRFGVGSRSANAIRLCAFFKLNSEKIAHEAAIASLHKLLDEVWDGSDPHAALLAKLIKSTRSFTIEERPRQN